jgi:glycosyltransferase involved in cell wall biosynthesis
VTYRDYLIRAQRLTSGLDAEKTFFEIDRSASSSKREAMRAIRDLIRSQPWDLVYLEGTGIAGGLNVIQAARARGQRYIVSSGDPIQGFFQVTKGRAIGSLFGVYERQLYKHSQGFVGWTPYLTGIAVKMGAPRGVTVEGAVDIDRFHPGSAAEKSAFRRRFNIPDSHLVCGVVGRLSWVARQSYCYGLELVETLKRLQRQDVTMLIVGDGDGLPHLKERVPAALASRVQFTGRLPQEEVVAAINAMDIGFVTQTLDQLGSFRLTTKLPEYLACGVPVAMSPIPGFYDYIPDAGWPLPAAHPAHADFHTRCAAWLDSVTPQDIRQRGAVAREVACQRFEYDRLTHRFCTFVRPLL